MHDIVIGAKTPGQAREYYVRELADYRRGLPTPYMETLRFMPNGHATGDPDCRVISDADLAKVAEEEGDRLVFERLERLGRAS
jgi:hypothetical protein